jgi:hypothetical protein
MHLKRLGGWDYLCAPTRRDKPTSLFRYHHPPPPQPPPPRRAPIDREAILSVNCSLVSRTQGMYFIWFRRRRGRVSWGRRWKRWQRHFWKISLLASPKADFPRRAFRSFAVSTTVTTTTTTNANSSLPFRKHKPTLQPANSSTRNHPTRKKWQQSLRSRPRWPPSWRSRNRKSRTNK